MWIEGSVALVSGGGSGLGAATARGLAGRGAGVVVLEAIRLDGALRLSAKWGRP